jgi:hypothetical protein
MTPLATTTPKTAVTNRRKRFFVAERVGRVQGGVTQSRGGGESQEQLFSPGNSDHISKAKLHLIRVTSGVEQEQERSAGFGTLASTAKEIA